MELEEWTVSIVAGKVTNSVSQHLVSHHLMMFACIVDVYDSKGGLITWIWRCFQEESGPNGKMMFL